MLSRPFHWAVHLVALPIGAFLVADMTNQVIGNHLEASIQPLPTQSLLAVSAPARSGDFLSIIEGDIFNTSLHPEPPGVDPVLPSPVLTEPPVNLKLVLKGTVVGDWDDGRDSFAVFYHPTSREQTLYRQGETVQEGVQLTRVERQSVLLKFGRQEFRLVLFPEERAPGAGSRAGHGREQAIQKVTGDRWILDRGEIEVALASLPKLLTKARVVPHFRGGKPDGFRIFSIVPGSFYTRIGLKNGDILQRINEVEVKDPQNFMQVFQQLKDESSITVDLVRNRQKQTFHYAIR